MKAVILAGGMGTRLVEETSVRPKPMVEIGTHPILWHILKIYSAYGINDFIICLGYKGYIIKEYFANYFLHHSDVTFDLSDNKMHIHNNHSEPWKITLVDTGYSTMTGGRLKRVQEYVGNETFCFTYGDGVSDVNIEKLIAQHNRCGSMATMTAVNPPARFGSVELTKDGDFAARFSEKPYQSNEWINGGFFVLEPEVMKLISGDECIWELEPMTSLAATNKLSVYRHSGFWSPMDTLRDKQRLQELWDKGEAPWKIWNE